MAQVYFNNTRKFVRRFKDDTKGSMTIFGLFFFLFSGILGAIALDISSLYSDRTHLQVAADQAAHAALYQRRIKDENSTVARQAALDLVNATLPSSKYGSTIQLNDIEFGTYTETVDPVTGALSGTFVANVNAVDAARATTSFTTARLNPAQTFLFRLIGIDAFDVVVQATAAATNGSDCLQDGFVSNSRIEFNNGNEFGAGFCLHSNGTMQSQVTNDFTGAIVSINGYDKANSDNYMNLPNGQNPEDIDGLAEALRGGFIDLEPEFARLVDMIDDFKEGRETPDPDSLFPGDTFTIPDYVTNNQFINTIPWETIASEANGNGNNVRIKDDAEVGADAFSAGKINILNCGKATQGQKDDRLLTISDGAILDDMVLITDCRIAFGSGVTITRSRIITTSLDDRSIDATAQFTLGSYDADAGCQVDADAAQLVTMGGFRATGQFGAYGSQIYAAGNVEFTSGAGNTTATTFGAAIVAMGEIEFNSNHTGFVGCNEDGVPNNELTATRIRLKS